MLPHYHRRNSLLSTTLHQSLSTCRLARVFPATSSKHYDGTPCLWCPPAKDSRGHPLMMEQMPSPSASHWTMHKRAWRAACFAIRRCLKSIDEDMWLCSHAELTGRPRSKCSACTAESVSAEGKAVVENQTKDKGGVCVSHSLLHGSNLHTLAASPVCNQCISIHTSHDMPSCCPGHWM